MRPLVHDDDPIGEAHRLFLIVGDVDGRHARGELLGANQLAHREPLIGVQGPERLVHQVDRGAAHIARASDTFCSSPPASCFG